MKRILTVAAHPDDEILGCGGTVARLIKEGHEAYTLILGEGITSRYGKRDLKKNKREIAELKKQSHEANKVIGVADVFICDYPDNRFDEVSFLDLVKTIQKTKDRVCPDMIFTHYEKDLNIDHQLTYKAVITATRPLKDESVKEVYSFEVLSSTEWNYPSSFSPDVFYDVSATIDKKLRAMEVYNSELRDFPHPRSLEGIRLNARQWGMKTGVEFAEAFKAVRLIL